MTFSVSHLKLRIILAVVIMLFFLWQITRLFPWLLSVQTTELGSKSSPEMFSPVSVAVFYEALCPDSKSFITKQVLPTYEKAPKLIALSLIPYGKAKTIEDGDGNISFSCQHGPVECQANKIHACAIENVPDIMLQVKYISCMISNNMNPEYIGEKCAKELSLDWEPILKCSRSKQGSELLKHYGKMTDELNPQVTFIPTVLLNNQYKKQSPILKNLFKEVCSLYQEQPLECDQHVLHYR